MTYAVFGFPFHLSFSYLSPAVEASLDTKMAHMEPNNTAQFCLKTARKVVFLKWFFSFVQIWIRVLYAVFIRRKYVLADLRKF